MAPKEAFPPQQREAEEDSEEEPQESESEEAEEEEEEQSKEEESETESDAEEEPAKTPQIQQQPSQVNNKSTMQKQITPPPPSPTPAAPQSSSSEEDDDDEEGEEEEESDVSPNSPSASDFTIKPITPTKPTTKDSKPTSKRPSEPQKDDEKDRKKTKTGDGEDKKDKISAVSSSASVGAGRVWSEEDEISVLKGMIDYQNQKGADPSADMSAFHEFVKRKLRAEVSRTQLYEKVRRLRIKYKNNVGKGENGDNPVFSKPHDCKTFDLSKMIWGPKTNGVQEIVSVKSNNGKVKKDGKIGGVIGTGKEDETKNVVKDDDLRDDQEDFGSKYPNLLQSFDHTLIPIADGVKSLLKGKLSLIGNAKAVELEEKWKKLRVEEAEVFLKKSNLMTEQTKLVLNAMKRRGN